MGTGQGGVLLAHATKRTAKEPSDTRPEPAPTLPGRKLGEMQGQIQEKEEMQKSQMPKVKQLKLHTRAAVGIQRGGHDCGKVRVRETGNK